MSKLFFSTIPLQEMIESNRMTYKFPGKENDQNTKNVSSNFSIIPVIANTVEKGEQIDLVVIVTQNPIALKNIVTLRVQMDQLATEYGFHYTMKKIETEDVETFDSHIILFSALLDYFKEGDEIFADITFGTKPIPLVFVSALNYATKIINVKVNTISYARVSHDREKREGLIYDVTSLFYMNAIIDKIAALGIKDPKAFIRKMLNGLA